MLAAPRPAQAQTSLNITDELEDLFFGSAGIFSESRWNWWWRRLIWTPLNPDAPNYADLPSTLSIEGDCNFRSPCHLIQNEGDFTLNCRPRRGTMAVFNGTSQSPYRISFQSEDGSKKCKANWRNNAWQGTCQELATEENPEPSEQVCAFNFNEEPEPVVYAAKLPSYIDRITACGSTYEGCTSVQDGSNALLKCDNDAGESTYLEASVVGDNVRLVLRPDGKYFRCEGQWDGQAVSGDCLQRGRNLENPETCDDYSIEAYEENAHGQCAQLLPTEGFSLQGCGMEQSTCIAVQRGCEWQISCEDQVYSGRVNNYQPGLLKFRNARGQRCRVNINHRKGTLSGSCSDPEGRNRCIVSSTPAQAADPKQCFTMPTQVRTAGCGAFWDDCKIYQDGCNFQTICENGRRNFNGVVTGNSISFEGLADYTCTAELTEQDGVKRLLGACTRENEDGTISECRDLSDRFGARLALDWDQ